MTTVSIRHPKLQVTLLKNVGRQPQARGMPMSVRFSGQAAVVDLTPYVGEQGSVRTSKTLHEPAGTFSLTLTDMINEDGQDSLYGLLEPMDVIHIRIIGDAYKSAASGGTIPVMMRGFISEVRRQESMGADGKPQRSVVISGQDFGKVWQQMNIFLMPSSPKDSSSLITSFPFFAQFGLALTVQPVEDFLQEVVDKVINPYLNSMRKQQDTGIGTVDPIINFTTDIQVNDANVMVYGLGGWSGGTIYSMLMQYLDVGPFNELWVDDREAGPVIVYRPNPFFAADGTLILPRRDGDPVGVVELDRSDVVSLIAVRSDQDVANYYWIDAPRISLVTPENLRLSAFSNDINSVFVTDYPNVNPNLYGTRRLTEQTQLGNRTEANKGGGIPTGKDNSAATASMIEWISTRRKQLIAQNRDNVVLERGSMRLKGNEKLRAGKYILLTHGNMKSLYYIVGVQHDFVPFGSYTTTVQFERGTGFIDRVQQNSPYYSELVQGQS